MKIGINFVPYTSYQGIETYAVNLAAGLARNFPEDQFVLFKNPFSPSFIRAPFPNVREEVISVAAPKKHLIALAQQGKLIAACKKLGIDVLFCASPAGPIFFRSKIVTIHDCAYDRFPEFANLFSKWYFKTMFYSAKYFSKGVIAVSEFSKKDLVHLYGFKDDAVHAIHSALPELPPFNESVQADIFGKHGLRSQRYFFYVGNTRPRKNIPGLLDAFLSFREKHDYKLVLAGKVDGRFLDIPADIKNLGMENEVVQTGFITDEEKVALYEGAAALAFPSYYEGFGFPVLEAQSLGVPVITSNTSSLPEVGGKGGALYIDPYDVDAIADAMEKVTKDTSLRASLIAAGYENVKRFSWDRTARETMAVLRQAAGE